MNINMSGFSRPDVRRTPSFSGSSLAGPSKHDLERDSGFSDASSEYHSAVEVTDSEDTARNGSMFGQQPAGQQVAVVGGSYAGLSPMIIMNNFVLKQPSSAAPAEKPWGFSSPLEVMPQSQVVLLQPMVSNGNSSSPKIPLENVRQSKGYMSTLKSYPKIAPQPVETPTKRGGAVRLRARSMSEYEQQRKLRKPYQSPSPPPILQTQTQSSLDFEAALDPNQQQQQLIHDELSTPQAKEGSLFSPAESRTVTTDNTDEYLDVVSMHSTKLKRFSNTYNILSKSGLLGITMRTKQLIKENKRTQGLLQQLQEHTDLLLEALSSGDPDLWTKLQLSLHDTEKEHWGAKAQRVLA